MKIYEYNNNYYISKNGLYYICDVMVKPTTIVIIQKNDDGEIITPEKEYTFIELKNKIIK